jgi:hypothetical protein
MKKYHLLLKNLFLCFILLNGTFLYGQEVPIISYSTTANNQVLLEVNSSTNNYYILKMRHHIDSTFDLVTSMTLGQAGTTLISESLERYPLGHCQVLEYSIQSPVDTDGDGVDDMTEYNNMPTQSPLNAAAPVSAIDGLLAVDSFTTFKGLSVTKDEIQWSEFLNGKGFVKYIITDFYTDQPNIYFINSDEHTLHADFAAATGITYPSDDIKGQIIYHPTSISNNGSLGTFAFNYSNGHPRAFEAVQKTYELLAANMPFLENNISYFITDNNAAKYVEDSLLFNNSRISILLEADVYGDVDYWGLNPSEGFGFFREMGLDEIPSPRDIVLYESLPNELPRVGGVMTSVIQTPLSHVNLRAIQNHIPNAFIRDPLSIDSIADLVNKYIYFKVEQDDYFIREATVQEVNAWYDDIRPKEPQIPPLNLSYKDILPLDEVKFEMFDGFGAKCANIATMRTFGFPEGTIPNGFGVPFYFYQEFMKHNNFFEEIETIINEPDFQSDRLIRDEKLEEFRKKIKAADMPTWMLDKLAEMHASFPTGTSIRCRSSTNNEDLPGFNGAGLYDSKTQHPNEGHISKSMKQVYASLWNLRAFEERDFYRIDHFIASMGVLCHPNYQDEKANGVGVSIDPIYGTSNTFYLNSQIGEDLITNPNGTSIPEELLLDRVAISDNDYIIIQRSNQIPSDTLILENYLEEMRDYLTVIHDEFALLYDTENDASFAMDIEYKITIDNQLIIKQARPWVSYVFQEDTELEELENVTLKVFPNPAQDYIIVECEDCELNQVQVKSILGQPILTKSIVYTSASSAKITLSNLATGVYIVTGFVENNGRFYSAKFVKK